VKDNLELNEFLSNMVDMTDAWRQYLQLHYYGLGIATYSSIL